MRINWIISNKANIPQYLHIQSAVQKMKLSKILKKAILNCSKQKWRTSVLILCAVQKNLSRLLYNKQDCGRRPLTKALTQQPRLYKLIRISQAPDA